MSVIVIQEVVGNTIVVSDFGVGSTSGDVTTSGTPADNDFAKFTDATTIEGRSYSETKTDLGLGTTDDAVFNSVAIAAGQKVMFEGAASDTYLIYNSGTSKLEVWVNGTKKADWG